MGRGRLSGAGESPSSPSTSSSRFTEALAGFLSAQRRKGRAEGTLVIYRRHLLRLFRYLPERQVGSLTSVTAGDVFGFFDQEIARERSRPGGGPLSSGTLCLVVNSLRVFFAHLVSEGVLLVDPARDLHRPRCPGKLPRHVPTARQMRRLVLSPCPATALGKRDRAILELMYGTGLRASELCGLSLGDVDAVRRQVFVRKGKGGKERLVPMGRKAAAALGAYMAVRGALRGAPREPQPPRASSAGGAEPLFLRRGGGAIRPPALRYIVAKSRLSAQLPTKPTPHTFRHACATHLLKGGAGIRQIQVLLGHSSLESTQIYTKVETSDLRAMLDRHHPRGRA